MKKISKFFIAIFSLFLISTPVKVFGEWHKIISHTELQDEKIYKAELERAKEWRMEGVLRENFFSIFNKLGAYLTGMSSHDSYNNARECINIVKRTKGAELHIKAKRTCLGFGSDKISYTYSSPEINHVEGSLSPTEYPWEHD